MAHSSPYGTWASPVTLDVLVQDVVGLSYPLATPTHVYWTEARPSEGGRQVIVRRLLRGGDPEEVVPPDFDARTTVHEYGGLCVAVHHDPVAGDAVYFSNLPDQRLYRVVPGGMPEPLTPVPPFARAVRYAAPALTPDGRHLVCVRERHTQPDSPSTVVNDVVVLAVDGSGPPRVLVSGRDFFSHPAVSPDGRRVSWVCWDHPNMPWDGAELWEAELDVASATVRSPRLVAGGPSESVTQPKYSPEGELHYVADPTGWWNLYGEAGEGTSPLAAMEAELGVPDFVFGLSSYALCSDGRVLATWRRGGLEHLGVLSRGAPGFAEVDCGFTYVTQLRGADDGSCAVAVVGSATLPPSVVRLEVTPGGGVDVEVVRRSRTTVVDGAYLSTPEPIDFSTDGDICHALYYAPANPGFEAPQGELPPLIVNVHGGPTSCALPVLNYGIQYWTSRGFAVVDVNYAGSAGYGRAYRERLRGRWGVVDVADCVQAARHLASIGRVDRERLLIHGASAGGYTALCAMTLTDVFAAGAIYYGIADATVLAEDTHKFELHYMDSLFGPWPETADVYKDRSPASHADSLRTPLIVFQGLEDKVVPPGQAELVVGALRENGVPHAYVAYEGEQHGFRKAESIRRTAEAELCFYARVLGFTPADALGPVDIVHEDRIGASSCRRARSLDGIPPENPLPPQRSKSTAAVFAPDSTTATTSSSDGA